jgi:DNA-binding NarL/FixJ family response regulator
MRGRKQHTASTDAIAEHNAKVFRDGVHRLWRAGLTDYRIAHQLNVRTENVKAAREELGLPANARSES